MSAVHISVVGVHAIIFKVLWFSVRLSALERKLVCCRRGEEIDAQWTTACNGQ